MTAVPAATIREIPKQELCNWSDNSRNHKTYHKLSGATKYLDGFSTQQKINEKAPPTQIQMSYIKKKQNTNLQIGFWNSKHISL